MLTKEENERLTRVGPGTPGGELLRRYWHPIAIAAELTEATATKFVRVLGEDLHGCLRYYRPRVDLSSYKVDRAACYLYAHLQRLVYGVQPARESGE